MLSRILSIAVLSAVFIATITAARPVEVTVLVLDPQDAPIPHALVRVAAGVPPWTFPSARTDEQGRATLTIEAADAPLVRARAFVIDASAPEMSPAESIAEMGNRMAVRQFDPLGYSTTILLTDASASIVAKANPAQTSNGQISGPGAANVTVVNMLTSGFPLRTPISETGHFSLPVPLGRRLELLLQTDEYMLVRSVAPLSLVESLPEIEIVLPPSPGSMTGSVTGIQDLGKPFLGLSAVSIDGGTIFQFIVRANGRFDDNQGGTIDPADPTQDLALIPGEYYIVTDNIPLVHNLSLIHAIRTNSAQQERAALVRMSITSDQRTVVAWDAATLTSTTETLVRAVLFAP